MTQIAARPAAVAGAKIVSVVAIGPPLTMPGSAHAAESYHSLQVGGPGRLARLAGA